LQRLIIVAGGNSVKEGIEHGLWEQIKGQEIWSINYAYRTMPYLPKREIWVDIEFYKANTESLQKLYEQGVEIHCKQHMGYAGIKEFITQYGCTRETKLYFGKEAIQKNTIYYGRMGMSGMFGLSLAIAEGYDEIYLLGYDFGNNSISNKFTHYYQFDLKVYSTGVMHPEVYRSENNEVKIEVEDYKVYLNESDVKIWNVSIDSNITYFDKITYEHMFERINGKSS
jgi:hypothetical protein